MLDATCAPSNIRYPQDFSLLNEAREKLETVIIRFCKTYGFSRPRMYRRIARKNYLALAKAKKRSTKKIRATIRKQLAFIRRDIGYLENFMQDGYAPTSKEGTLLLTIYKLYEQQQYMYQNKTHSVDNRIVSIAQPWIRPIVRGKTKSPVEFGAKFDLGIDDNGLGRIEKISYDAYNESTVLKEAAERFRERTGHYPERILADQIYRTRENRKYCKMHGIRLSGPKLGRPSLEKQGNYRHYQWRKIEAGGKRKGIRIFFGGNSMKTIQKAIKKRWYIIVAVMVVLVIVGIFCFVRWERKSSALSFQFEETVYDYENEYCRVKLSYPQMTGNSDKEKESKINRLIEADIKKLMELAAPDEEYGYIFTIGNRFYEIEYADEKFISISYDGWAEYQPPGRGLHFSMMATTIDCEEMKVLELKDVVSDLNGLCQMLMEDRFKHITAWDGEPDLDFYKVSTTYSREGAERDLLETLNGNDREIEWYIKERKMSFSERWSAFWGDEVDKALAGKDFVIVILKDNYNEYAIDMRQIRELLKEDFVESMLQADQGESEEMIQTSFFFDYGTETAAFEAEFASTPFGEYEQVKIQVEQVEQWENGILYTMMIESDTEDDSRYFYGRDRFFLGYFYVSEDKIYRIDENKMEEVNIKNEEDFIARGTVVCQEMGKEDSLKEEKGWHEEIMVEGTVCTYRSYNDLTETGYYERFVWEKGKGLIEYKSGFGAERDQIYLRRET